MAYRAWVGILALLGSGCGGMPDWSLFAPFHTEASGRAGDFKFAWRLSGDRQVAPLQAFDDGRNIWLQFAPGQAIPAIFASTATGDIVLDYRLQGPYVVVDRLWSALMLRGGGLSARVERTFPPDRLDPAVVATASASSRAADTPDTAQAQEAVDAPENQALVFQKNPDQAAIPKFDSLRSDAQPRAGLHVGGDVDMAIASAEQLSATGNTAGSAFSLSAPSPVYQVSPSDQNIRLALMRWAGLAGWTFLAEHWSVDADIPIIGAAAFDPDFTTAVQQLVASTERGDRPLQPCFYSNRVLRVVPYAQPCDRTAAPEAA